MALEALKHTDGNGFGGSVSGMTLADLIQIKHINRFTGRLSVQHRGKKGLIFFREGELVHAELGDLSGCDAFFAIMHWPGGEFDSAPKISTTIRTINENLTFLLLEAHRLKDEQAKTAITTSALSAEHPSIPQGGPPLSDINNKLASIPEVEYAVVLTKDGVIADDDSYEGSTHGANALFLSLFSGKLGNQLGSGELISAAVHGCEHHLLLFKSKNHFLGITASGSCQLPAIESTVRKQLSQK